MKRTIFNTIKYDNLTRIEIYIMDRINKNPETVVAFPISRISVKWSISLPSLTRFSRKIGFSSFANLRLYIVQRLEQLTAYEIEENGDPLKNTLALLRLEHENSFGKTFLDEKNINTIDLIAEKIIACDNLLLFGMDMNKPAANIMDEKFSELGINSRFGSEEMLFSSYINVFSSNAVCIIFSKTLGDRAYEKILDICKRKGVVVFLITSSDRFPEYKRVSMIFDVAKISVDFVIVNLQIAIVNGIFTVMLANNEKLRNLELENWKIV